MSRGAQKNFDVFMQELRVGKKRDWLPDESYYKLLIAKAILYKTVTRIVPPGKVSRLPREHRCISHCLYLFPDWRAA